MVRLRVRIRFSKQGDLRLIGHRDLMRCLERLFRRAGLALGFSQGFHPKPRMTFPLALAVGIEGLDEVMEVELAEPATAEELLRRSGAAGPAGARVPRGGSAARGQQEGPRPERSYEAPIPAPEQAGLGERIERLLAASSWPIERARGRGRSTCARSCPSWRCGEGVLAMRLRVDGRGSVGPRDVLAALGLAGIERQGVRLRRTAVEIAA